MDSKGKKIGILFVLCTLLAVVAVVLFAGYNRLMGKETGKAATDSMSKQIIEADGKAPYKRGDRRHGTRTRPGFQQPSGKGGAA